MYRPPPMLNDYHHRQWRPNFGPRGVRGQHWQMNEAPGNWRQSRPNMPRPMLNREEHWCETCDKAFPSMNELEKHKAQHQKCNIDGCQFVAHPKVITNHIQMQHSTGLYKKIANFNKPEDVIKWREERKNRYPTKENVAKKDAQDKEKIERGEKMGLKHNKNKWQDQSDLKGKRNHPYGNRNQEQQKQKPRIDNTTKEKKFISNRTPRKPDKELPSIDNNRKLKPFTGILDLLMEFNDEDNVDQEPCSDLIADDGDYENVQESPKVLDETQKNEEPAVCGALSSLICNYGSSDEEMEPKDDKQVNGTRQIGNKSYRNRENKTLENRNSVCIENEGNMLTENETSKLISVDKGNDVSDNDSGPEELKVVKEVGVFADPAQEPKPIRKEVDKNIKIRNDNEIRRKRIAMNRRTKRNIPSTLLQKLLQKEIRQERNIVLQCIRHIVKHNYYDKK